MVYIGKNFKKVGYAFTWLTGRNYIQEPADEISKLESAGVKLAKYLFVAPEKLNQAQIDIKTPGTVIYKANEQLKSFLQK